MRFQSNASSGALFFTLTTLISSSLAITPRFDYGSTKVRGVNLGGWLVLEPWITPSLFEQTGNSNIVDEYTFCQYQDPTTALTTLQEHWETWITEGDFREIRAAGLNHVRIPIGYWAFDVGPAEPYRQGQKHHLDHAISWAEQNDLKVIINLHGVPGSQNGFDNSGQLTASPSWHLSQSNVDRTRAIIQKLSNEYKESSVVTAISVLNEPLGFYDPPNLLNVTKQYFYDSYGDIRYPNGMESNTVVIISDAFQGLDYWQSFMTSPKEQGVMLDIHMYQMFVDDDIRMTDEEHIRRACNQSKALAESNFWTIVGEFTPAATDCAKYLNGRHEGARYEGAYSNARNKTGISSCVGLTGNHTGFSHSYKDFLHRYWKAQISAYEKGAGWIQWTWKTESADEWSYKVGLDGGWINPLPLTIEESAVFSRDITAFCSSALGRFNLIPSFLGAYSYPGLILLIVFCVQVFLW